MYFAVLVVHSINNPDYQLIIFKLFQTIEKNHLQAPMIPVLF